MIAMFEETFATLLDNSIYIKLLNTNTSELNILFRLHIANFIVYIKSLKWGKHPNKWWAFQLNKKNKIIIKSYKCSGQEESSMEIETVCSVLLNISEVYFSFYKLSMNRQ